MPGHGRSLVIRDPLWNAIRLDPAAVAIIDTAAFQRLRYIRQLGLAHLVYPGATHTRFDHALGVYHLATRALRILKEKQPGPPEAWRGERLIPYAALLHDIGHYAFSHALEELEPDRIPGDHEEVGLQFFQSHDLRSALEPLGKEAGEAVHRLIRGGDDAPLRGLVSGSLDLDKMEYLRRDARFCGVPYGAVDVDRLLQGLALLRDPETGKWEVGLQAKALSALESLLFSKYQMFRTVYWHHGVRAATGLYKRIVETAVEAGLLSPEELVGPTDEALLHELERRAWDSSDQRAERIAERWLPALRNRRLPKRAAEATAWQMEGRALPEWASGDSPEKRRWENEVARELGLAPGEAILDFPVKKAMFQLDVLVDCAGKVVRMGRKGIPGLIDLPRLARELYRTARVLRLFTFERRKVSPEWVLDRLTDGTNSVAGAVYTMEEAGRPNGLRRRGPQGGPDQRNDQPLTPRPIHPID